jgi:hypothetical protein
MTSFPSFLKRGEGRFYGIASIEKSPSIPLIWLSLVKEKILSLPL